MSGLRKKRLLLPILFFILAGCAFLFVTAQEDTCEEERFTFTDRFDTTEWKAPQSSVTWLGNGEVHLNWLGANFQVTEPSGMGAKIYVCDAGDFDGDGKPDLMGLDIANNHRLILVRNDYFDLDGDGYDDDGTVFQVDPSEVYDEGFYCGPATMTVADYNNDGLLDFFFMKNRRDEFAYTEFVATMFINVGTETDPDFYEQHSSPNLDFTSRFQSEGIYINWAADHFCSVDIDQDDDMDVLVASQDKIFLVRNPGTTNFEMDHFEISELNYDQRNGYTSGIGGSSVDAGDFDNDGDIDVIVGSGEEYEYIVYYENDGTEGFTRQDLPIPYFEATGTIATCVADFDHNGFLDIFAGTDKWKSGTDARMWIMRNQGFVEEELQFNFDCLNGCNPILPSPHDVDMSATVDYDSDGDMDVVLADANHSGDYYLIINQLAAVYTLHGEAISKNVTPDLDPNTQAITRVRLRRLDQFVRGGSSEGLTVTLYVSNNGGKDWEFLESFEGSEIANLPSASPWHYFTHFGSRLKWKAVLTATEDEMEEFEGASFETPVLTQIRLRYAVVDRREYSRTSVAAELVDEEGQPTKLIIGGSFYFPGWQGHLRAYDVTDMTAISSSYSELRTITRPDLSDPSGREIVAEGVTIKWDAGELLTARSPSDRTIYTALDQGGSLARVDFDVSNVEQLRSHLNDFQNDNTGLIEFIRGEGREWLLGDINHSNPVVVGPPDNDPSVMGSGYSGFVDAWSDREKMVIVGANDGIIHCFYALTGEEAWGFIPNNLLPKLRNMWQVDEATGDRYYAHDVYVDGSPVVEDVHINGEWKTVLICGQGAGQGRSVGEDATGNYYFALDITDIENPQPLWEFTEERMGETWSVPVVGRIMKDGQDTWTAFMGSGYDNVQGQGRQGHRFYAVDISKGEHFFHFNANPEMNTRNGRNGAVIWSNEKNVARSIPGSPGIIDTDNDGYSDAVYVGDTEGRVWKIDVSLEFLTSDPWDEELLYEDPHSYPIITKPAVWIEPGTPGAVPRIYFGTGGDDKAPDDATYSFIALMDGEDPEVEWYMGDPDLLGLTPDDDRGDLSTGEKVWADPKIANSVVYFSTLTGDIESVDPCESLSGIGRLYGRYVRSVVGTPVGSTAFRTASGQVEHLGLEIKTRAAVTIGETTKAGGVRKKEVYIQEYDSTLQKLEQPAGPMLRIKSWREIFKIIK
ncbi:MAG: hypothetical protein GF421_07870 [Candidatus Aminicenantes bacterium]|nr:hypothetical protein [Candidatus Aminicenantes bacterium]